MKYNKGFTLIEILIAFTVSSVVAGISLASFNSYSRTQVFNQNVSEVVDILGIARSRSISQVKPAICGNTPLEGYEVRVTPSNSAYAYYVRCGGTAHLMDNKRMQDQVVFSSSSATSVYFNVSNGTVRTPGDIIISGFGRANTIIVESSGKMTIINGTGPPPNQVTPTPTPNPTAQQGCSSTVAAYRLYPPNYCVYTAPGHGDYCDPICGQSAPTPTTTVATATPTTSIANPTPTPTPTPTTINNPTPTPSSSVTISLSVSPNPATTSQSITFTATVTGTNCTPTGAVYFYRDGQANFFTAASTGSTNPGVSRASYSASTIGIGAHTVRGRYAPSNTTCPSITSTDINFSIQ